MRSLWKRLYVIQRVIVLNVTFYTSHQSHRKYVVTIWSADCFLGLTSWPPSTFPTTTFPPRKFPTRHFLPYEISHHDVSPSIRNGLFVLQFSIWASRFNFTLCRCCLLLPIFIFESMLLNILFRHTIKFSDLPLFAFPRDAAILCALLHVINSPPRWVEIISIENSR